MSISLIKMTINFDINDINYVKVTCEEIDPTWKLLYCSWGPALFPSPWWTSM